MKRFKSRRQAQSFLSTHDQVANLFHIPYSDYTTAMPGAPCASEPLAMWSDISKANLAA
jgi:putative transposase